MKPFEGYKDVEVKDFGERLEVGGHICKILDVNIESYTTKENKTYEKMRVKIDFAENDRQPGYYAKKFEKDATKDAMNAKWKGYFDVTVPKDNSDEVVKKLFKTFTTSVEHSNPGYDWIKSNWDEKTLIGKLFGGVFGLEEFTLPDGKTIAFCRCRFARGIEKIEEAGIPKVKLLDGTYEDYEDYINRKKAEKNNKENPESLDESTTKSTINDSDLPF